MDAKISLGLLVFFDSFVLSIQTVDLNLRQLQFVSDHLTKKECGQLIAALNKNEFRLDGRKLKPVKDGEPCLMHLVDWNKGPGKDGTVEDLTLPLHQIGRADIAKVLAKAVHDETAYELHKNFLDDPFKKIAKHKNSQLLTEDDDAAEKPLKVVSETPTKEQPLGLTVIGFTVTLLAIVFYLCRNYCKPVWVALCPKQCVTMCEALGESIQDSVKELKRLANKHVMGREDREPLVKKDTAERQEREKLVQDIMRF